MFRIIGKNKMKTGIIVVGIFIFLALILYLVGYLFDFGIFIIPFAVIISIMVSFFSYYYSDKMVLKLNGARPADPETDKIVTSVLENICIAAGTPMPRVYIIDDPSPNAFATGRNPEHAVVCVTTGILKILDYYELEGVLAHELSHIKNYDILLTTVATIMIGVIVIVANFCTRSLFFGGGRGRRSNDNSGGGQAIILAIGLIFIILAPIAGQLLKMALSRNREYLADATAVEFTRNPQGLIGALSKLESNPTPLSRANKATASMYIVNPLKGINAKELLSTHPPIQKRIEALKNIH